MTFQQHVCPHCGYDLLRDEPIILNDFSMIGPDYPLCYKTKPVRGLTQAQREIVWALMKACPRVLRYDVLLERLGSIGTRNIIAVHTSRMRAIFQEQGIPMAAVNIWGRGWMWDISIC